MTKHDSSRTPTADLEVVESGAVRTADCDERSGRIPFPTDLLIDLPNWLGDLVMAFPAVHRLARANAEGRTVLHVRPAAQRLVEQIFPEAAVVANPRKQAPLRSYWSSFRGRARFDRAVTLRNASRAKILLRLVSRWSSGTCSQGGRALLSWCYQVNRRLHQVHDADAVLERLGLPACDSAWRIVLPGSIVMEGARALTQAGVRDEGPLVGLAPGVALGGAAKQWPSEHFGQLARTLREQGIASVVVIGPGESSLAGEVVDAARIDLPVVGARLDAAGLAGVLSRLNAVVGNDSGPAHLAAILDVPGIVLFGPTDHRRTAPLSSGIEVMSRNLECSPCGKLRCPLEHQGCLQEIMPKVVADRLQQMVLERRDDDQTLAVAR